MNSIPAQRAIPTGEIGEEPEIAILMAVCNGEEFLDEQLVSLERQTVGRIDIWVSDDGSKDGSPAVLQSWSGRWRRGAFHVSPGPCKGFAENFRSLLVDERVDADFFAFCDQDDIWDDDKLEAGLRCLIAQDAGTPALYCSRTRTLARNGTPVGCSPDFRREPSFRNALVQSIAGGNTMLFNRAAREELARASSRTGFISHDWWAYLVVTGVGGLVHYSSQPRIGYRQHHENLVGANNTWRARLLRLDELLEGRFARWNSFNVSALRQCWDMLTPEARSVVEAFSEARTGGILTRAVALRRSGVYRQTILGQLGLYLACILKRL